MQVNPEFGKDQIWKFFREILQKWNWKKRLGLSAEDHLKFQRNKQFGPENYSDWWRHRWCHLTIFFRFNFLLKILFQEFAKKQDHFIKNSSRPKNHKNFSLALAWQILINFKFFSSAQHFSEIIKLFLFRRSIKDFCWNIYELR